MRCWLIRHARTAWNAAGRIQGHADIALDATGVAQAANWRLPAQPWSWFVSPLQRAKHTARLMGAEEIVIAPSLIEMHWGEYEGRVLVQLREQYGSALMANEACGLDFRPPGGESPREVQTRVLAWLIQEAAQQPGREVALMSHKGVLRALLAAATQWDMAGKPPVRWRFDGYAQVMQIDRHGGVELLASNVPLTGEVNR